MDFSQALTEVKKGSRIQREGWNGKDQFVYYMPGYPDGVPANEATAGALGINKDQMVPVLPYLGFRTTNGTIVPWVASQTDLLAADWRVLE